MTTTELDGAGAVAPSKTRLPSAGGLSRSRLHALLGGASSHGLALVVAPAGSGKTTLLTMYANAQPHRVAWYQAEASESDPVALLRHLEVALRAALSLPVGAWCSVEQAAMELHAWEGGPVLLVIDDLHTIAGSPAEAELERFLAYMPPFMSVVAAARRPPAFNLSRLQVAGKLVQLGSDDLRFRTWEVEQLFGQYYCEPLPPEDMAELTRRTEGWAAGLQLFHLATRGKPVGERRSVLTSLATRSQLAHDYLARNVIGELPTELRSFLIRTSVLGRLSGPMCDALLGSSDSQRSLEEIERRQIFIYALGAGTYRYHEVLRSYLDDALVEQLGASGTRDEHRRAAALLERFGFVSEALRSFCRAEDWSSASRLLGHQGEEVIRDFAAWAPPLPPALVDHDPWLLLATARHDVRWGRLPAALHAYHRAEAAFDSGAAAAACRHERSLVAAWAEPASHSLPPAAGGWTATARAAVARRPGAHAELAGDGHDSSQTLGAGVAALLAGQSRQAVRLLQSVAEDPHVGSLTAAGTRLLSAVAERIGGQPIAVEEVEWAVDTLEGVSPWLARLGRAFVLGDPAEGAADALSLRAACLRSGNAWGAALAGLVHELRGLSGRGGDVDPGGATHVVDELRALDAGVLASWAESAAAVGMAMQQGPTREADAAARRAAKSARVAESELGALLACHALSLTTVDAARAAGHRLAAAEIERSTGLRLDALCATSAPSLAIGTGAGSGSGPAISGRCPAVTIRCFGAFTVELDGQPLDCGSVKPRARTTLRLLAMHGGRTVHRDTLIDALWPDHDSASGTRNLQVAVSSLRQLLNPGGTRGGPSVLCRDGDGYCLSLPSGSSADVAEFDAHLCEARRALAAADPDGSAAALEAAIGLYTGDLLPEDGAAEWVVKERDERRQDAVHAAQTLARLRLDQGSAEAAISVCEWGLRVDRCRDRLWQLLLEAADRAGDRALAAQARRSYLDVLEELDVEVGSP